MTCSICPGSALTAPRSAPRNHDHVDVFSDQAIEQLQVFRDHSIQVEDFRREHLLAAESQQLTSERRRTVRGVGDFLRRAAKFGIIAHAVQQEFAVAGNHHQQIVEIVRNATGEPADCFHLLRLTKLLFQRALFRDVFGEQFEVDSVAFAANGASRKAGTHQAAVFADPNPRRVR